MNATANVTSNSTANSSSNATKVNTTEKASSKPVPPPANDSYGDVWNRYDHNVTRAEVFLPIPAPYDTKDYPKYNGNHQKPSKSVRN